MMNNDEGGDDADDGNYGLTFAPSGISQRVYGLSSKLLHVVPAPNEIFLEYFHLSPSK